MTGSPTSVTAALAGFGTWLVAHICRWNSALSSMAGLIAVMEVAVQTLAADLPAGWVALVAGDVGHLGLATHTLLGDKHNARGAGLTVWVARMVRQRGVTACASSGASVSAFGDRGTARNRRVYHSATASTGEFVKGGVHAGIAVSLMAEHLTGVDTTLQLLAAGQGADVRFQSCQIAFLALGLVLSRTAPVSALMLAASAETSAGTIAGRELIPIKTHIGADALHLRRSAATVDRYRNLAR